MSSGSRSVTDLPMTSLWPAYSFAHCLAYWSWATNGESNVIMAEWVKKHPKLAKLHTIGKSFLGVDLTLIEITNQDTGPGSEKPALYVDGNIHSTELTSGALALYFAGYLIDRYGKASTEFPWSVFNEPDLSVLFWRSDSFGAVIQTCSWRRPTSVVRAPSSCTSSMTKMSRIAFAPSPCTRLHCSPISPTARDPSNVMGGG